MNVLITSVGRRVSLLRAFQKELKSIYPSGKVYGADARPQLSAACHVADGYFKVPRVESTSYISTLLEQCIANDIKLIIPTIDTELFPIARNKERFLEAGVIPVVSSTDFVAKCRDKREIHEFFKEHDIQVAREYDKNNYELPLFIKPIDGSRSENTYIIKEGHQLRDFHFTNDKLMFLEYLDHSMFEEFTCDMYYDRQHRLRCAVPRKRMEVRDGEVSKGLTVANELVPFIIQHLGHIPGAVGCLTTQFFRHRQTKAIYGIEINPRFGGGFPLSYLAGANFPAWILDEYLHNRPMEDQFDSWEENLLMIRYDDEILVHGYQDK